MLSTFLSFCFCTSSGLFLTFDAVAVSLNTFLFKVHMAMPMPGC